MTTELQFLVKLISTILYGTPLPQVPGELDWKVFFELVQKNGLLSMIYEQIRTYKEVPEKMLVFWKERYDEAFLTSAQQDYYGELILQRFEKAGVRCLPLKGLILRNLYPQMNMRTMSDLDILIGTEQLEKSRQLMQEIGFHAWRYDEHHDIYHTEPNVNVELHKLLIVGEMEDYFQIGFERAHLKENHSYTYEMSKEDFYMHMIGHMAYHFAHGGVGIRLVLDIRVYLDKYAEILNRTYIDEELKAAGLYTFHQYMEELSAIWFLGKPSSQFYDELSEYILDSGYLGTSEHKEVLKVVQQIDGNSQSGARRKAIVRLIFPKYRTMAFLYPSLKRFPWLLPFTWIARIVNVALTRKEDASRLVRLSQIDDSEVQKLERLYHTLDMKHLL